MPRDYWACFTSGAPSTTSGLAPTFITFINGGGSNITPPSVSEPGTKGLYKFSYDATQTIAFVLDGATTGLGSGSTVRYLAGVLDPQDTFGSTLTAIGASATARGVSLAALSTTFAAFGVSLSAVGTSLSAQGASIIAMGTSLSALGVTFGGFGSSLVNLGALIGSTASSIGSTSVDPVDLFGFLKRAREFQEGNQTYIKATGILDFYSRGSSTLLVEKTVSDTATQTTKT